MRVGDFLAVAGVFLVLVAILVGCRNTKAPPTQGGPGPDAVDVVLAVHGGTAELDPATTPPERQQAYRDGVSGAVRAGYAVLRKGGSSVDAVQAVIMVLEDNPLFNAGKGAVFNTAGKHELDASIMDGRTLAAGAVAGVQHVRNPIAAARLVMDRSPSVLLSGTGADEFAARQGLRPVAQNYYDTEARWKELLKAKRSQPAEAGGPPAGKPDHSGGGTVGAVARTDTGDLAAGTSTGGLTNKMVGRVGDSPIIGAGTYAANETVAVSATGKGEVFIRGVAAGDIAAQMRYAKVPVWRAAHQVVVEKLLRLGGTGGVIALDSHGRLAAPHSTRGLIRGWVTADGRIVTKVLTTE